MKPLLLLIEDEPALARGLADAFRDEGYEVCLIARGDEALAAIRGRRPQLVVLDVLLPGRSGLDVLRDLRSSGDRVPVLMLTAKGDVVDRVGQLDLTPHDILVLKALAERRGEVVARIDVIEDVCGLDSEATLRTVDNHVMALRKALGDDPRRPRWIQTVKGEGYRLARDDKR